MPVKLKVLGFTDGCKFNETFGAALVTIKKTAIEAQKANTEKVYVLADTDPLESRL